MNFFAIYVSNKLERFVLEPFDDTILTTAESESNRNSGEKRVSTDSDESRPK
jgi:hypothetical protein